MNHFKPWKYYRHCNCLDVDIAIIGATDISPYGTYATVMYWNRHWKQFQGESERVFIRKEDYSMWTELKEEPEVA